MGLLFELFLAILFSILDPNWPPKPNQRQGDDVFIPFEDQYGGKDDLYPDDFDGDF